MRICFQQTNFFTVIMICNSNHLFIMCESTLLVPSHETVTLHAEIEKMQRETSKRSYLKILEVLDRKIIVQSEIFSCSKEFESHIYLFLSTRSLSMICVCARARLHVCEKSQHDCSSYKYIQKFVKYGGYSLFLEKGEKVPHFLCANRVQMKF